MSKKKEMVQKKSNKQLFQKKLELVPKRQDAHNLKPFSYNIESHAHPFNKYWAKIFPPLPEEILSSWMTRIAHANLSNLISFISQHGENPHNFDFDLVWKPDLIRTFSERTGISEEILASISMKYEQDFIDQKHTEHPYDIQAYRKTPFTNWGGRGKNPMRFCPLCLKSDKIPYFRKVWRFNITTTCPVHNSFLENYCPECKSPIVYYKTEWDTAITTCIKCGANITSATPQMIDKNDPLYETIKTTFSIFPSLSELSYYCISFAWIIAFFSELTDPIFNNHPLTKELKIMELWKNAGSVTSLAIFSDLKAMFLLTGAACRYIKKTTIMLIFFRIYSHTSKNHYLFYPHYCPVGGCPYTTRHFQEILTHIESHPENVEVELKSPDEILREGPMDLLVDDDDEVDPSIPRPYKCDKCQKSFTTKAYLNVHIRDKHPKQKEFRCDVCNEIFKKKREFLDHIDAHGEEWPWRCPDCHHAFQNKRSVQQHKKWYH